jgi:hypothetical protein
MPFGELFTGTFGQLWRHKRLWLFGLLGFALTSIGLLIYQVFQFRWQSEWFTTMGDLMKNPGMMPEGYFNTMMSSMVWLCHQPGDAWRHDERGRHRLGRWSHQDRAWALGRRQSRRVRLSA